MSDDDLFELSVHAADMVREREIRLEWVERTLRNPAIVLPDDADPALLHALGRIDEHGGRVLRIVYNHETAPWRVATAYLDRKQRNRL